MAVSPAPQEKVQPAAVFSLRHPLAPALSIRRRNNSASKPSDHPRLTMQTRFNSSTPELAPLNTTFPSSPAKFNFTVSAHSITHSPISMLTRTAVPLLRVGSGREEVPADTPLPVSPSSLSGIGMAETMDGTQSQRGGLDRSDSGTGAVDAKSRVIPDLTLACSSPVISRSPSPSSRDDSSSSSSSSRDSSTKASSISSTSPTTPDETAQADSRAMATQEGASSLARSDTIVKRARKLSIFLKNAPPLDTLPPIPPVPKSVSVDRLPTTPSPTSFRKVKDEMWEAFKTLESDYQKFQNKTGSQKASIVRQCLLTFLRKYKDKSSNNISPELLERRTQTLYHWWTGLMAQLRNRNPQGMTAGVDKPSYLEAILYIISRPEWRAYPSSFAPLALRLPVSAKSVSSASLSSTASSFSLQRSVQHNIKTLFTRTLYDTLAYVVEQTTPRPVSSAHIAFGGKVIAYAFFFCAGVAEMLISLWGLQPTTLKWALSEFGIWKHTNLGPVSDEVICEFPETLHSLGFTTLGSLVAQLKKSPNLPVGIQVDWHGPWISRWCGRDTDLLYVFFKQYHVLMFEYLPTDATIAARLCAPGYVTILAQLLSLVDNTIHRNLAAELAASTTTTFEDIINASAAIPIPARGVARTMAENKLVVLLRDVLFDDSYPQGCRECYMTSFSAILRAAVRRTRMYDSDACFQLCDLVEELLPILARAGKQGLGEFIDWKFWLQVIQLMFESEHNMTELRVISFVYTTWDLLVEDEDRKRTVCLDWLLSEQVWQRFFCNWCSMVRAYYMRLLCWRLGRCDGDATEVDVEILKTLLLRLRTGYAHHLRIKKDFEENGGKPSSTAPCLAAPGRRLVIIRNMAPAPQGVLLDGIVPTAVPFVATPGSLLYQTASLLSLMDSETRSEASTDPPRPTETVAGMIRKWSIRGVFGFKPVAPPPAPPEKKEPAPVSPSTTPPRERSNPNTQGHFKFSLDNMDRTSVGYGRERILGLSRLPAPAQRYLDSLGHGVPVEEIVCTNVSAMHWTYVGRALAEWTLVIVEHESFFDRRKAEGRETDSDVETPTLVVDAVRKF